MCFTRTQMSPSQTIPVLRDNNNGIVLSESNAILTYLADTYKVVKCIMWCICSMQITSHSEQQVSYIYTLSSLHSGPTTGIPGPATPTGWPCVPRSTSTCTGTTPACVISPWPCLGLTGCVCVCVCVCVCKRSGITSSRTLLLSHTAKYRAWKAIRRLGYRQDACQDPQEDDTGAGDSTQRGER
jgi:hypothetical protein